LKGEGNIIFTSPPGRNQAGFSLAGGTLEIRLDTADGPLISEVKIPQGKVWNLSDARLAKFHKGIHNVVVVLEGGNATEIDWIRFAR